MLRDGLIRKMSASDLALSFGAKAVGATHLHAASLVTGTDADTGDYECDWDEALVVACLPDGTYVLEYVDEGLIEEGVPPSRMAKADGADALASATRRLTTAGSGALRGRRHAAGRRRALA